MKKILVFMCSLLVGIICVFGGVSTAYATTNYNLQDITLTQQQIKQTLVNFVYGQDATTYDDNGARVNRTAGSKEELAAANYLLTELKTILNVPEYAEGEQVDPTKNEALLQSFSFDNGLGSKYNSQNVVAMLKSPNATSMTKTVIIGAHYDNYYNYSTSFMSSTPAKAHGIYDNAGGVTALIEIAKIMAANVNNIDYNIMFVLYGAEEMGMCGSRYFYNSLKDEYKNDILLAINLDAIGAGDNMYMYADEVSTLHQDYFKDIADQLYINNKSNAYFNLPPVNKKVSHGTGHLGISYTHMGLASDNYVFVAAGVNTINFFSGAWSNTNKLGIVESSTNKNISHTSNDNLTNVEKLYGDVFYQRILSTVNLVCNALVQQDFSQTMTTSKQQKTDYRFFTNSTYIKIILISIIVVVYLVFILTTRKKLKQTPKVTDPEIERLRQAVLNNNMSITVDNVEISTQKQSPQDLTQEQDVQVHIIEDDKPESKPQEPSSKKSSTKSKKDDNK